MAARMLPRGPVVEQVFRDAYDGQPGRVFGLAEPDAAAEGVAVGEVAAHDRLADDRHRLRVGLIRRAQVAPGEERDLQRREVAIAD
jgi:hypothetical protein